VIRAAVVRNLPLLAEAAVDAAYRARFASAEREGGTVKVTGLIRYQFPDREASSNNAMHPTRN